MTTFTFTVIGTPAPQGSHIARIGKGGRAHVVDSNVNLEPWRERVLLAVRRALPPGWVPLTGPVGVSMIFHLPRPKSAPKTRDVWPAKKPDIEKLVRAVHDSCTDAGVWRDDGQVVCLRVDKYYAVGPDLPKIYDPEVHVSVPGVTVLVQAMKTL